MVYVTLGEIFRGTDLYFMSVTSVEERKDAGGKRIFEYWRNTREMR